jgi:hypothetical protein
MVLTVVECGSVGQMIKRGTTLWLALFIREIEADCQKASRIGRVDGAVSSLTSEHALRFERRV